VTPMGARDNLKNDTGFAVFPDADDETAILPIHG
jgi:hypothetical protein